MLSIQLYDTNCYGSMTVTFRTPYTFRWLVRAALILVHVEVVAFNLVTSHFQLV